MNMLRLLDVLTENYPGYTDFTYTDQSDYLFSIREDSTHLIISNDCSTEPSSFIYKGQKYYICNDKTCKNKNLIIVFKDEGKENTAVDVFIEGKRQNSLSIKNICGGLIVNLQGQLENRN
jgi:hypothetical protein